MVEVGSGFRPVLPFRGRGASGGQPDALLAPDLGLGAFAAYGQLFQKRTSVIIPYSAHLLHLGLPERDMPQKQRETGVKVGLSLWGGVTTLPFPEKSTNPSLRLQIWLTGVEYGRGQGCNNARTPGCSLVFIVRIAILKNAAGTLCNVASFMLPFASTSGFRSCGF